METSITKDILKNQLKAGPWPAAELLYTRYSGMLFSYILQFVNDRNEGERLLEKVFTELIPRLQQALDSSLSLYCWLQIEARKIVLGHLKISPVGRMGQVPVRAFYFSLLEDALPEQQWVFRELFLYGRTQEELAVQSGKDLGYIRLVLRDALHIIRNKLA